MNEIALVLTLVTALAGPGLSRAASFFAPAFDAHREVLRNEIESILHRARMDGQAGVLVVSLDHGDTLFIHNPDLPLAPASNQKLFTTFAALHYLGPSFRYNTYLLATGPVREGVLEGDLVLYGTGDPTLSDRFGARVLEAFADTLAHMGIREIRGAVIGDASYFGGDGIGIGWQPEYSNAIYAAPASALSFSENVALVEIRPGAAGDAAAVRIAPGGDGLEIVNRAVTVAQGRTRVSVGRASYDGPLMVQGQVSRSAGAVRYAVPVADPPFFAAGALREAMEARHIAVRGGTRAVHDGEASPVAGRSLFAPTLERDAALHVLAIHTSPPLIDVLEVINKRSQNFMAEQVLRTVGRVVAGDGTVQGGTGTVMRFAADVLRVDTTQVRLFDGSGLSPLNRTTASAMVRLLAFAAHSPMWKAFLQTLPEVGARDGMHRMTGTPAQGRVWAKTGTINHVSALSGYVRTAGGELLEFSIVNNRAVNEHRAKRTEDAIVVRLAMFDRAQSGVPGGDGSPNR